MARIRTIKPEFFRHEELQKLDERHPELRPMLVFAGLWTLADKLGRFEWRPKYIKLDVLPFLSFEMAETLAALEAAGFVRRYEVDRKAFGEIPTFPAHQRIEGKEAGRPARYPAPSREATGNQPGSDGESTGKRPGSDGEATEQHPVVREREREREKEREKEKEKEKEKKERPPAGAVVVGEGPEVGEDPEPGEETSARVGVPKPRKPTKLEILIAVPVPDSLRTPEFLEMHGKRLRSLQEARKLPTETALKSQLADAAGWGIPRAVAAVKHSLCYQGLYEPGKPNGQRNVAADNRAMAGSSARIGATLPAGDPEALAQARQEWKERQAKLRDERLARV